MAERIVLEVFVGCHGSDEDEALEGCRGQLDRRASLLEALEIDEGGNAAAGAAAAVFGYPLHESRRLVSRVWSVESAWYSLGVCFNLTRTVISLLFF